MVTIETMIHFVADFTASKKVKSDTDIFFDLGCVGDDFERLMDNYESKFNVDLSSYIWYFHSDEEGIPFIGQYIFPPPYERVQRIPITPAMLLDFANSGKWGIEYPPHQIPSTRWDIRINQILIIVPLFSYILYKIFD